jgi:hypothetical protein
MTPESNFRPYLATLLFYSHHNLVQSVTRHEARRMFGSSGDDISTKKVMLGS